MKDDLIRTLEKFLEGHDFGKNWDGAYQDAVPTLRRFFQTEGFHTAIMNEWDSESREAELVATRDTMIVRIPWAEDCNGLSVVHLQTLQVQHRPRQHLANSAIL
jgi:hypothetical protein